MSAYCTVSDLYDFGLPRGAVPNPGRLAKANAVSDAIELDVHGFAAGAAVQFRPDSGGELPAGLTAGTVYYALPVDEGSFQVSATEGGAAIDLTTAGTWFLVSVGLPFDAAIEFGASVIDQMLPAHILPLESPYPQIVKITNAELAVAKLLVGSSTTSISDMLDAATKRLERWAKGVPLRGDNTSTQKAANVATHVAVTVPYRDQRGWSRFGGTGGGCS